MIVRITVRTLAIIGATCVLGAVLLAGCVNTMFTTQVIRSVPSPDKKAVAEIEVRKGGLGTVWTTRVNLRTEENNWTVYQAKDSDFQPPLNWDGPVTLIIGLPCERFDYVSNPDDWQRSDPTERRLRVRVKYPESCGRIQ